MNVRERDRQFLSALSGLCQPTQAQVGAVAEAIGCPEWTGCCDAVDHPRRPHDCYCAKAAADVLKLSGQSNDSAAGNTEA